MSSKAGEGELPISSRGVSGGRSSFCDEVCSLTTEDCPGRAQEGGGMIVRETEDEGTYFISLRQPVTVFLHLLFGLGYIRTFVILSLLFTHGNPDILLSCLVLVRLKTWLGLGCSLGVPFLLFTQ